MRTRHSPLFLLAPLTVVLAIAGFALIAAPAASAKKTTPQVTELKIYRTPSGPQKGALTVIATADFSGKASDNRGRPATRSLAAIIVTLIGARHSITVSDTVRITQRDNAGKPVRFDIRIPQSAARLLKSDKKVRVTATVTRELSATPGKRLLRVATTPPQTRGWRCEMAQAEGYTGTCEAFAAIFNTPPPAPPVGFQQYQNGTGPGYWSSGAWVPGGDEALICVSFWGSAYGSPTWYSIGLTAANDTTVGYVFQPGQSTTVAGNGQFSYGSYLDTWVGGYAQVTTGPTLSGSIPTSVLNAPVGASTGNATLNVTPQVQNLPTTWSLSPLSQSEAAGVC